MAFFVVQNPGILTLGVIGNVVSLLVFLAPVPTFYRICKSKSTQRFHSVPYSILLLSATVSVYYSVIHTHARFLLPVSAFGSVLEAIYILIYLAYAPQVARVSTLRLMLLLNVGIFSFILFPTLFLSHGSKRDKVMGWIRAIVVFSLYIAPLSATIQVIRTKSVEFMPFALSVFLTIYAAVWSTYGFLLKDNFLAVPNVPGFILGALQLVTYAVYRRGTPVVSVENLPTHLQQIQEMPRESNASEKSIADQQLDIARNSISTSN